VTGIRLSDADAVLHAPLPRSNGELVFDEPWQGRVLGMTVATLESLGLAWADIRPYLVETIGRRGYTPGDPVARDYYAALLEALEALVAARGLGRA
jgi:nitrile hydratase accessory protein